VLHDWSAGRHVYARDVDLLLSGGRVASIALASDAPPPDGARGIDARRMLVMPSLVNVHTHPTSKPSYRGIREDHGSRNSR
jgi:cytosine/adenosine deaminase-related metal-dependent hydrolase